MASVSTEILMAPDPSCAPEGRALVRGTTKRGRLSVSFTAAVYDGGGVDEARAFVIWHLRQDGSEPSPRARRWMDEAKAHGLGPQE